MLDHPSSINSVAWHPLKPSLLVGGSFDGELVLWDLASGSPDEPMVSVISELSSKEPITSLQWVFDPALNTYLIAAVSTDGKLLLWDPGNMLKWPVRGFLLRSRGTKSTGSKAYPTAHGGASLAFSGSAATKSKWALVGQQGGNILRCQASKLFSGPLISEDSLKSDQLSYLQFRGEDVSFAFVPHVGMVSAVSFSPFHRSIFLSAGLDGIVRIFHVLESRPLLEWEPAFNSSDGVCAVTAAEFSPTRPTVFAVGLADGRLLIYDLSFSTSAPASELKVTPPTPVSSTSRKNDHRVSPVTGLSFNRKQRDLLAACDSSGAVCVWKLSWNLTVRRANDLSVLDSLAKSVSSEESRGS